MKKKPIIQKFTVPEYAFVNMQNGAEYVKIPLENLDVSEINELCTSFVNSVAQKAGYNVHGTLDFYEEQGRYSTPAEELL